MVQKIKNGTARFAEWLKNAQTLAWAVALVFAAGVAWSQVSTKSELERCKVELKSEFMRAMEDRNKIVLESTARIEQKVDEGAKEQKDQGKLIAKIDGKTEVLMKAIKR